MTDASYSLPGTWSGMSYDEREEWAFSSYEPDRVTRLSVPEERWRKQMFAWSPAGWWSFGPAAS